MDVPPFRLNWVMRKGVANSQVNQVKRGLVEEHLQGELKTSRWCLQPDHQSSGLATHIKISLAFVGIIAGTILIFFDTLCVCSSAAPFLPSLVSELNTCGCPWAGYLRFFVLKELAIILPACVKTAIAFGSTLIYFLRAIDEQLCLANM